MRPNPPGSEPSRYRILSSLGKGAMGEVFLGEAVEMYGAIGMPRHLEMAREMLKDV